MVSYPIASRNLVTAALAAGSSPAIGSALRSAAPAGRAREARCQKVMLLNTFTTCAVPRCRWSTSLLDSEPSLSPDIRPSRCGMELIVSKTGLLASGCTGTAV